MAENKLILVVDDDPISGDLTSFLLKEAGYEVVYVQDSRQALSTMRAKNPIMVILDMLMPGPDGLSLCRQIKGDPQLKSVKTVIVSGKNFDQDKALALKAGAETFITKPYDVESFAKSIAEVLARRETAQAAPSALPVQSAGPTGLLEVVVWGARSPWSAPTAAPASRFSRNSSCLSVRMKEDLLVFDAGSGVIALGEELLRAGMPKSILLFLTHLHPDHVEGFSRWACALPKGVTLRVSAPQGAGIGEFLDQSLTAEPQAAIEVKELAPGSYEVLPGVRLEAFVARHPGVTLGFTLQAHGLKIVYCPDNELGSSLEEQLIARCAVADLLIHDARYDILEASARRGQGHSSWSDAVDLALRANVKRLLLFHLDERYNDSDLDRIAAAAGARIAQKGRAFPCEVAHDGLRIPL